MDRNALKQILIETVEAFLCISTNMAQRILIYRYDSDCKAARKIICHCHRWSAKAFHFIYSQILHRKWKRKS